MFMRLSVLQEDALRSWLGGTASPAYDLVFTVSAGGVRATARDGTRTLDLGGVDADIPDPRSLPANGSTGSSLLESIEALIDDLPWRTQPTPAERVFMRRFAAFAAGIIHEGYESEPTLESLREHFNLHATWWLRDAMSEHPRIHRAMSRDIRLADEWFEGTWKIVEPRIVAALETHAFKEQDVRCGGLHGGCGTTMTRWRLERGPSSGGEGA